MKKFHSISILMLFAIALLLHSCDTATTLVATDPTIKGFDVYSAKAGDVVTITGEGFGSATDNGTLYFGDVKAPIDIVGGWTDTKIKVKVPADFKKDTLIYIQIVNGTKKTEKWSFFVGDDSPKTVSATSKDSSSVIFKWSPSKLDVSNSNKNVFDHYHLIIRDEMGVEMPKIKIAAGTTSYTATNLKAGSIYQFDIKYVYMNDTMSAGKRLSWSPAFRFVNTTNDVPIKLYESASSFGSGLDLFNATGNSSDALTIGNSALWNLGVNTKGGKLVFGSASALGYNYSNAPQDAEMAAFYYPTNSLNDVTDSQALDIAENKFSAFAVNIDDLETEDPTTGYVFIVRTMETGQTKYNYAKVHVKRTGGKILQGSGTSRYIEVEVSYQKKAGVPYAKVN